MKKIKNNTKTLIFSAMFLAALGAGMTFFSSPSHAEVVDVYLTRTCGCCKKWVDHLNKSGFKTKLTYVDDLSEVKSKYNIPQKASSCHTGVINGKFIEGHVPASAITKMLKEKSEVRGIAVPGMPMGSPGMEGPYRENYDVIALDKNNNASIFASYN